MLAKVVAVVSDNPQIFGTSQGADTRRNRGFELPTRKRLN